MIVDKTFHTFNSVSDLVRVISRIKKTHPDIPVISLNNNQYLTKLALGYLNKDLEINDENIITIKEYESLENKENYNLIMVLG